MLNYERLKKQPRQLVALTGLTVKEFKEVQPAFEAAYREMYPIGETPKGQARKRKPGAGRKGQLAKMEDKLLFILVYQKTYPLQVVQGELFGISQSRANYWVHHLLPVLQRALDNLGVKPERDGQAVAGHEHGQAQAPELMIDGTERRRQRPKNAEKQALHYSGKKKAHSDKNLVVVERRRKRVVFLSQSYPGRVHDKKMADQEHIVYPCDTTLYQDTGFQGYAPHVALTQQPQKSRAVGN